MTKATILFIHGGGEGAYSADKKLVDRLSEGLGDRYEIIFPQVPDESDPDYEKYKITIEEELNKIASGLILAGHSLGACLMLKYISEREIKKDIYGIFLLSTPFWGPGGWEFEGFSINNELAAKRVSNTPVFFYHGTDDEIVPFSHMALYEAKFQNAKFREMAGQGHQFEDDLSEVVKDITTLHRHS
jgi:uncharacterized protein